MALGCCWQMGTMDWSWWLVNLRPSTSKTISISLTLQAHPLIRMKKVTRWLSTFHLQSAVQRAPMTIALLTPPLCGYPGTTCPEAELTLLHSVGEPALHQQHPTQWDRSDYLPAKCLRWCFNRAGHTSAPLLHEGGDIWPTPMNSPTVPEESPRPSGWSELHAPLY